MSDFRDAIAGAVCGAWGADGSQYLDEDVADSILATPEMQAIREALRHACWNAARHRFPHGNPSMILEAYLRKVVRLPESVIAWVLDGDE